MEKTQEERLLEACETVYGNEIQWEIVRAKPEDDGHDMLMIKIDGEWVFEAYLYQIYAPLITDDYDSALREAYWEIAIKDDENELCPDDL